MTKPPLGLKPRYIHIAERLLEIKEAINRYMNCDKEIPVEWILEYNELTALTSKKPTEIRGISKMRAEISLNSASIEEVTTKLLRELSDKIKEEAQRSLKSYI